MLALSRLIDTSLHLSKERGIIPESKHYELGLWVVANAMVMFSISGATDTVNKDVAKFYTMTAQLTKPDR